MSYVADPLDTAKPEDSDFVGLVTPAEIRALKLRVNNAVADLEQAIIDMGNGVSQSGATNLADAVSNLNTTITAINNTLTAHLAASNPHSITKATVGLGKVNNFEATSSLTDGAADKYALAAATKELKDLLDALDAATDSALAAIGTTLDSHDTRISTAQNSANSALSAVQDVEESLNEYKNRDPQMVTQVTLAANVRSIAAGSTNLLTAFRTQLKPGIYTLYGNISNSSNGAGVIAKTVDTFLVTEDVLYAGTPPGTNQLASGGLVGPRKLYGVSTSIGTVGGQSSYDPITQNNFRLEISSPTSFSFIGNTAVFNTLDQGTNYYYCNIARIMYTPL